MAATTSFVIGVKFRLCLQCLQVVCEATVAASACISKFFLFLSQNELSQNCPARLCVSAPLRP